MINEMKPFRFWVQSVLPVVYDDSLSYLEIVSKLTVYINKLIENDNYFNQELNEIKAKLDNIGGMIEEDVEEYLDSFVTSEEFISIIDPLIEQYIQETVVRTFPTYGDAVSAGLDSGESFNTLGFRSVNDGGEGTYMVSDTVPSGVSIAYGAKYCAVIGKLNVKALGAYGDGVHDDAEYFTKAGLSQKILYIPEGEYVINSGVSFSNKSIIGSGCIINLSSAVPYDNVYLRWQDKTFGEIKNITFIGGSSDYLAYILGCIGNANCKYEHLIFKNNNGYCLRINGNTYADFSDIYAENITGGEGNPGGIIYGQAVEYSNFNGIKCKRIADHAIYLVHNTHDITISDCELFEAGYNSLTAGAAIVIYGGCERVTINNCVCRSCKNGIDIKHYEEETSPKHVIVIGCICSNNTLDGFTMLGTTGDEVTECQFIDCTAINCGQDGFNIRYVSKSVLVNCNSIMATRDNFQLVDCINCVIDSCCCTLSRAGSIGFSTNRGTQDGTENLTIRNCTCYKEYETAYGYLLRKIKKLNITNCNVIGVNDAYDFNVANSSDIVTNNVMPGKTGKFGISFGNGAPVNYGENIGDLYINTDPTADSIIYQYTAVNTWTAILTR